MVFQRFIENIVYTRRYESTLERGIYLETLALLCQRKIVKYVTVSARMCAEELESVKSRLLFSQKCIIEYTIYIFVAHTHKNMHVNSPLSAYRYRP